MYRRPASYVAASQRTLVEQGARERRALLRSLLSPATKPDKDKPVKDKDKPPKTKPVKDASKPKDKPVKDASKPKDKPVKE